MTNTRKGLNTCIFYHTAVSILNGESTVASMLREAIIEGLEPAYEEIATDPFNYLTKTLQWWHTKPKSLDRVSATFVEFIITGDLDRDIPPIGCLVMFHTLFWQFKTSQLRPLVNIDGLIRISNELEVLIIIYNYLREWLRRYDNRKDDGSRIFHDGLNYDTLIRGSIYKMTFTIHLFDAYMCNDYNDRVKNIYLSASEQHEYKSEKSESKINYWFNNIFLRPRNVRESVLYLPIPNLLPFTLPPPSVPLPAEAEPNDSGEDSIEVIHETPSLEDRKRKLSHSRKKKSHKVSKRRRGRRQTKQDKQEKVDESADDDDVTTMSPFPLTQRLRFEESD